jgi:hypothetical protein
MFKRPTLIRNKVNYTLNEDGQRKDRAPSGRNADRRAIGYPSRPVISAASRTANTPQRQRLRRLQIFQSTPDRARGDARNTRHRRYTAMARSPGFRSGEQTPLTFIKMRQHLVIDETRFLKQGKASCGVARQ